MTATHKTKAIVCLMGPTAAGKTDFAIKCAQAFPFFSIISVDSGMVYRGMDIGTAKPTHTEQNAAPHRLIDICDPSEAYSAARFRLDALREIEDIFSSDRIPLLVGGTMLYFKALQQGISALPSADPAIRAQINAVAAQHDGLAKLYARLQKIDPVTAARLAPADTQRIQRALEVYELTGRPLSELCAANPPTALPYRIINVALAPTTRAATQERIALRLQLMLQQGLVEEVARLFRRSDLNPNLPALRAVGYRQVWQYLAGEIDCEKMQELILIATRQLAKRQMTWLRNWHDDGLTWLNNGNGASSNGSGDNIESAMQQLLQLLAILKL